MLCIGCLTLDEISSGLLNQTFPCTCGLMLSEGVILDSLLYFSIRDGGVSGVRLEQSSCFSFL